jgi:5-methylcytosine-specific restriction endonuclease McrA
MPACRICLRDFQKLRFYSSRIAICGRCVNTLNESHEVAENAEKRVGELLLRGMERNALRDLELGEPWQKAKAQKTLSDIGKAYVDALPQWLNRLLANPENTRKDFKLLRAHRRGLLHYDRPAGWGYPNNWKEVASRIRRLDGFQCIACAAQNQTIDVHHIVYVSNFGTHQQSNLISLCRECHETEHKRSFDLGETESELAQSPSECSTGLIAVELPVNDSGLHENFRKADPAAVEAKRESVRLAAEQTRMEREREADAQRSIDERVAAVHALHEQAMRARIVERPFWQYWLAGAAIALVALAFLAPNMKEGPGSFLLIAFLGAIVGFFIQSGSEDRQKKKPEYVAIKERMAHESAAILKPQIICPSCAG